MADPSLQRKLAQLSPTQLAQLRAKLIPSATPAPISPRDQSPAMAGKTYRIFQGQKAWPATSTQARLWFLDQYHGPNAIHNVVRALKLEGELQLPLLSQAFQEIVNRHEILRTNFVTLEGMPYQIISPTRKFALTQVEVTGDSTDEIQLEDQIRQWGYKPFNLEKDSLLRGGIFCLNGHEFILLLVAHHIIMDGWSFGVLAQELSHFYTTSIQGKSSPLAPPLLQFADYGVWLQEQLSQGKKDKEKQYWQEKLAGELPLLDLLTDRPRPREQTYHGRRSPLILDSNLVQRLKALARQQQTSLFMVLLASFNILLHRYTHQTDIIVGTAFANRHCPELEAMMGNLVDNLPLRTDLSGNPPFLTYLDHVRQTTLEAFGQSYPFAELLDILAVPKNLGRSPIFSAMIVLQNTPKANLTLPGIVFSPLENKGKNGHTQVELISYDYTQNIGISRFDLSFLLKEEGTEINGFIEYNQDLFDPERMERMAAHWRVLLEGIVAQPEIPIGSLTLLTPQEQQTIVNQWNQTHHIYDHPQGIHRLWEAQVQRTPDAIAVVRDHQSLTYGELNAKANQLARYLQDQGVTPGDWVGIYGDRSLEMMIGLWAILKAGGAYLPLDKNSPPERLKAIFLDAQPVLMLNPSGESIPLLTNTFNVRQNWSIIQTYRPENLTFDGNAEQNAYCIYTSGSTGNPKGVMISHGSLMNLLTTLAQDLDFSAPMAMANLANLVFDIAALELFGPLMVGGRVYLVNGDMSQDGIALKHFLDTHPLTHLQATPPLYKLLQLAHWSPSPSLKMTVGGDVLSEELAQFLTASGASLKNLYGPTETTIYTTSTTIHAGDRPITIGRPIANTQAYLLDAYLQPVPVGITGELYIGGAGLALGYLNQPELTAEKFITNPFGPGKLYKTGDLGRYLSDGRIEFLGRRDHQVKIRGFRIELGEIEAALAHHPQGGQNLVMVKENELGEKDLVAYFVPKSDAISVPTPLEWRNFLKPWLPDYMIPQFFVALTAFPLTVNGKIDRRALPDPVIHTEISATSLPQTPLEQRITDIWQTVLKIPSVGTHDNFFALGGHSLLATQAMARLAPHCSFPLPLQLMFEHPTPYELAIAITTLELSETIENTDDLNQLLAEINDLSEADIQILLDS